MNLVLADPPVRLQQFANAYPNRNTFTSICQQDLSGGPRQIAQRVSQSLGDTCIAQAYGDSDATMPGLQPDCVVEDVVGTTAMSIPACETTPQALCWSIAVDSINCFAGDHHRLDVHRTAVPAADTVTRMRCVLR